ncbi:MAG: ABC transporter permease, partial [Armatimonadota bacterium]|nr:ABC transporter permease [Armatimonadota bacterium]
MTSEFESATNAPQWKISEHVTGFFNFIGEAALIGFASVRRIVKGDVNISDTINQMALIGFNSLPIVLVTTAFSGAVLALYTSQLMVQWGVGSLVGGGVSISVT